MWTTFAFLNWTIESPSVCAGATWVTSMSSPFRWKASESVKVMTGSAAAGAGGTFWLNIFMNCSVARRLRTFSWATMTAPSPPRTSLPPVWSPCQWVLKTKRTGFGVSAAIGLFERGGHAARTGRR